MKNKQKLIYSSKDYSLFIQDDTNRDVESHPKLKASMKEHGWLSEHPAVVVPDGGKFRIKDGGHRITIAKELGLPIYYVVSDNDDISIAQINEAQKRWTNDDYVSAFVKQGNQHYRRLVDFCTETGLPVGIAASLLGGNGGATTAKLRSGEFRIKAEQHARDVLAIAAIASGIVKWGRQSKFLAALSMTLRYSSANPKVLADKIRSHGGMLIPQADSEACIEMLQNIYNYRNREPISIALAVKQNIRAARHQSCAKATEARKK